MAPPSKIGRTSTNRTIGSAPSPSSTIAAAELKTEIYTYFARPPQNGQCAVLYNADRLQAKVTLQLETSGPVAVGTKQNILPVRSGKGTLLETGEPTFFYLAKGERLYVAATSINRIKVTIEPIPWAEQIVGLLSKGRP